MKLEIKNISNSLNKAYLAQCPYIDEISLFKDNYANLLKSINPNDNEETLKDYINIFFRDTYYKNKFTIKENINNIDLVIYNGKDENDKIGVIIETKALKNNAEMITKTDLNKKAFQELMLYYLEERIINNNVEIKHLIITNSIDWCVFNVSEFERIFYQNKALVKKFNDWYNGRLESKNKDWFYSSIAKPFIENEQQNIACTYLTLPAFETLAGLGDQQVIELYKIFSPEHLLKLPFQNDSNTLNREFYNELLHIIGLQETKVKNLRTIERLNEKDKQDGSLIENTINILQSDEIIHYLKDPERFGETEEEQLFSIGLELCITWVNRILFLKLLESQLVKYNSHKSTSQGESKVDEYFFLNYSHIRDFEELRELFFEVLAVKPTERKKVFQTKYQKIPYLNSSLFELTELEKETIKINQLKNHYQLQIFNTTVLKDESGKKISGSKPILQYLFDFLDSYNFASDNKAEIQEKNKTIINSSVLGLIFEKINGYKEGSYYTPGFVTMYMCRENIRKTVVEKFNSNNFVKVNNITELYNQIDKIGIAKANEIFNSIKICDPAVGSGHFLVSALNELIAIKSELKIIIDNEGKKLRDVEIEVINDELYLTLDNELYTYNYRNQESQKIQETIFHEKQNLIENCLFGVDINPKSVNICRLRLWIELLKNAYYTKESNYKELETLPNIDINIKYGNSLISHFSLNGNASAQSLKTFTQKYKQVVADYKNTTDRNAKRTLEKFIAEQKENFARIVNPNDEDLKKIRKIESEIGTMPMFFNKDEQIQWQMKLKRMEKERLELQKNYDEKLKTVYNNAFEWRYEFPEVLDDNGYFVGFDLVIGNPPYIGLRTAQIKDYLIDYYKQNYKLAIGQFDIYSIFIELSKRILNKTGVHSFIVSKRLATNENMQLLRKFITSELFLYDYVDASMPFESANVESIIISTTTNKLNNEIKISNLINQKIIPIRTYNINEINILPFSIFPFNIKLETLSIIKKISNASNTYLGDVVNIVRGFEFGYNHKDVNKNKLGYKIIKGENINKYNVVYTDYYIDADFKDKKTFKDKDIFLKKPKLLTKFVSNSLCFAYDDIGYCNTNVVYNIHPVNLDFDLFFLLGFLNSKLINHWFFNVYTNDDKIFPHIQKNQLESIPLLKVSKIQQQPFIKLVNKILEAKKENPTADTTKLEQQIDILVYNLYKLTEEDIELIIK